MTRPKLKFTGSFMQLEKLVSSRGIAGDWEPMGKAQVRFVSRTGGIMNWWCSTGTINFQGPPEAAYELKVTVSEAVRNLTIDFHPIAGPRP